ncbi:MAG: LysR family transcriptional regulator [Polyangiaceae bacterium]
MDVLWDDVRILERVERRGSVSAAARELGLSASTVYRRLGALEAAVGQSVVLRGPGPAVLTDAGRAVARVGRSTRLGLSEVAAELRSQATSVAGRVSFTTVEALAPLVAEPLAELAIQHGLEVDLVLGDDGPSVRDREVDVALGIMKNPPPGCWGRKIGRLPYGVFATRDAIERKETRWVRRTDALRHTPEAQWEEEHAGPAAARAPFTGLLALAAAGAGLALAPRLLAARHPSLVELTSFRPKVGALSRTLWLLTHPDQRRAPRILAVMRALSATFAGSESDGHARPD